MRYLLFQSYFSTPLVKVQCYALDSNLMQAYCLDIRIKLKAKKTSKLKEKTKTQAQKVGTF